MKALSALLFLGIAPLAALAPDPVYLDNGTVRIGLDRSSGGAIFFFGESRTGRNLLNHYDRGRFIQQSYYGAPDGSTWNRKRWRWNPVQGGNWKGKPAKLLALESFPKRHRLHAKTIPHHWAGDRLIPEACMEQWVELFGPCARIRFRFTYEGETSHPAADQELPAVFVDAAFPNLWLYDRKAPWTEDTLKKVVPGWPNEAQRSTENWAAYTNDEGWGLGVYFPGTTRLTTYRFAGAPGPRGSGCSYFAPLRTIAVEPDLVVEYTIHLTIGTVAGIRARFATLAAAGSRGEEAPRSDVLTPPKSP